MTTPAEQSKPIIGDDISWDTVEGEFCRVIHFTPFATVDQGKVKAVGAEMPYASLSVESQVLIQESSMPVVHRVDFQNAWEIFQVRSVQKDEEVLVSYYPYQKGLRRLLRATMPRLHYSIYRSGWMDNMETPGISFTPIAEWKAWE